MTRSLSLLLPLLAACSTVQTVERPVSAASQEQLAELLRDRHVRVTYVALGERPEDDVASEVQAGSDSVQWSRWESRAARQDRSPAPRWEAAARAA